MRRPITVARYLDVTEAQLARVRLGGEGIEAFVIEGTGFNPLLNGASGGVQLQVRERDLDRAQAILAEVLPEADEDADPFLPGGERVVRCPRCELEYCSFTRGSLVLLDTTERWRCQKCEHVWDDPDAGPQRMTPREPGDPRPVFRLARRKSGMGFFLGLMVGFFGLMVVSSGVFGRNLLDGSLSLMIVGSAILMGWLIGRSARSQVCSEPSCRAPLPRDAEECPRCKGTIAGSIESAPEHFSVAADARREVAISRQGEMTPKKKKKKKSPPIEPAAPAP
jgi:putative signal transducing protein